MPILSKSDFHTLKTLAATDGAIHSTFKLSEHPGSTKITVPRESRDSVVPKKLSVFFLFRKLDQPSWDTTGI